MMKKALQSRNNILDRSIYEDAMFMRMNTEMGNATQVEYSIYQELLTNILEELNHVVPSNDYNLMILIKVSYDTMVSRIKKRGREYEQIENDPSLIDYYGRLLKYYEEFEENYNQSEMLVIDGDKFNFVENIDDRNHILDMIEMKLVDLGNIDCSEYETLRQKRLGWLFNY